MTIEVRQVLSPGNTLGESPIWAPAERALWWVNCENPAELLRWSPGDDAPARWAMPQRIGGFVPKAGGGLLVALADGAYDFAPETGALALRAASPFPAHVKLHECHCDRQGRFWVGGFDHHFPGDRNSADAAFSRLDGDRLVPMIPGITVANGLAFSPDGRTMYAASSPSRKVMAFDLDPASGSLSNPRTFLTLERGYGHLDGATVDADGGYWLAVVGAAALRRYRPDGTLDREIALPCSNPTKAAFGGDDMATLFVTSTTMTISPGTPGGEANGGLFALRPGVRGVAETPLAS